MTIETPDPKLQPTRKIGGADNMAKGISLMVVAMLMVPMVDAIAKLLSSTYSPLFICWMRYAAATLFAVPWSMARSGVRDFLPRENFKTHIMRTLFMVAAMICYFLAIANIPLADAVSAYFVGPIVAALLAVPLLGERLTSAKLISLALGFGGAIVITRPGGAMDPNILLALAAGILFAGYMITTRQASLASGPTKTLTFQCLFGTLILLPLAIWTWPAEFDARSWMFLGMGAVSVIGHWLSIIAFRHADASTLAPFVYVELLGSVVMGFLLFGDWPNLFIWIGASMIVAGGVLLARRQP